jgi:RNA polymerase sigma-70 factor, ECF subfamily
VSALDPESLPRHLDRLYRAAWALCGSPHDAEDLVQETCARVLARPRRLRGHDELPYLMTVLRNTFLTELRTAGRRPRTGGATLEEIEPVDLATGERPEEALQAREVFTAIAGLPERYRLALVAVDIAGLSYREAAAVLETKEATIATRVFRARQQVALKLRPAEERSGATLAPAEEHTPGGEPAPADRAPGGKPAPADRAPSATPADEHTLSATPAQEHTLGVAPVDGSVPERIARSGKVGRSGGVLSNEATNE